MAEPTYKTATIAPTNPVDNRVRKVVLANVEPVCWLEDYEEEIFRSPMGEYYERYAQDGTLIPGGGLINYKLYLRTKSNLPIVIEVRFFLVSMLSPAEELAITNKIKRSPLVGKYGGPMGFLRGIKDTCENSVNNLLQGKLSIKITDSHCDPRNCPITYKIVWVDSEKLAHYTVRVYDQLKRPNVHGSVMSVGVMTTSHIYAHEFLHCVGLPDEYSRSPTEYETVRYYQPDGALGQPLLCAPSDPKIPDPPETLSIMSTSREEKLEIRHCYPAAIEVKSILKKATGRDVICELSRV